MPPYQCLPFIGVGTFKIFVVYKGAARKKDLKALEDRPPFPTATGADLTPVKKVIDGL